MVVGSSYWDLYLDVLKYYTLNFPKVVSVSAHMKLLAMPTIREQL